MIICIIDTSVWVELLDLPGMNGNRAELLDEFEAKIEKGELFLLPLATIIETGNHIGQLADGGRRRDRALQFVEMVQRGIRGEAPYTVTPLFEFDGLHSLLDDFADWAVQGSGLGDLSIKYVFDEQRALHPYGTVYIWSQDCHLSAFSTA